MWLSSEDRKLYEIQIASRGKVGYTTEITAPSSSIHPSKRVRLNSLTSEIRMALKETTGVDSSDNYDPEDEIDSSPDKSKSVRKRAKRQSTALAAKVSINNSLSSKKMANVFKSISNEGIEVPTPNQTSIWRSVIRD